MSSHAHKSRSSRKLDDPESQVIDLVSKYRDIKEPRPVLRKILGKPETYRLLWEIIAHQLALIKSRSQAFEDSHVTVYDKALLILSNNGNEISNAGALELYIEEFMGISPNKHAQMMDEILDKHIALKALFVKLSQPDRNGMTESYALGDRTRNSESPPYNGQRFDTKASARTRDTTVDDKITRILNVYFKAKEDYYSLEDADYMEKANAARFLRDTAENALNCLRARGLTTHRMVPELEEMFQYAKDKATELLGGKKRRFEITEIPETSVKRHRQSRNRYGSQYYRP
ncbi:hypothetical protein VTN77DRAFT_240 [Rasamsonia byssochlamydoides]|uniref:uncharacterized protein n=1 Tax=Rasamsonia byssochlamydoides TaxID=89139 RepID=UPI003741F7BE